MSFDKSFNRVVLIEGGYADDPYDSGGKTKWGITEAVARRFGYHGEMADLEIAAARQIYRLQWWRLMRLDDIETMAEAIADELFDTGVNCGVGVAGKFLQRALNALNNMQKHYADITVDGIIGPGTLYALREYLRRRGQEGETVLLRLLNSLQGEYYVALAERREKDESFLYGWIKNRVNI